MLPTGSWKLCRKGGALTITPILVNETPSKQREGKKTGYGFGGAKRTTQYVESDKETKGDRRSMPMKRK